MADEELAAVRIRTRVGHRQCPPSVLARHRLVGEAVAGPSAAGAGRIAALNHESFDNPVEDDAVVEAIVSEKHKVVDGRRGIRGEQLCLHRPR